LTILDHEMIRNCFKVISGLIINNRYPFTKSQLKAIIYLINEFLDLTELVQEPLTTLLILIEKKVVIPQIYDILERAKEKILRTHNRQQKKTLKRIFLSFFCLFPLTEKLI